MNREIGLLLVAQFLTAFADNAILFTAIAMVLHAADTPTWYVPTLQAAFLVSFVVFAPWVGPYADRRPKPQVLVVANIVKALGAGLMLLQVEPLLAYALVGAGAALYGPAKYGILPELGPPEQLVRYNGWVEGSTILAILAGSLVGGWIADRSVPTALIVVIVLYLASGLAARLMARQPPATTVRHAALPHFAHITRTLLASPRARFATLGVSLFWGAAAVLRIALIAWAPAVLFLTQAADIAALTLYTALGIAVGSIIAPRFIPLHRLRRARLAAYCMGLSILALALMDTLWGARVVLLLAGVAGGLFVVPINAALQDIGHRSVGSGGAVAVQHFFENLTMLVGLALYAGLSTLHFAPAVMIMGLGAIVVILAGVVSWHLPKEEAVKGE